MATFNTQNGVSFALRHKYFQASLQQAIRNRLISQDITKVDTSNLKTIENPYISTDGTATMQAVAGTYSVTALATTEDTLTVTDEVVVPTHIFDFEAKTANFELFADFLDNLTYQVQYNVDRWVLNKLLSMATGTYSTPAGGFTTPANIQKIIGDLLGKVAGYAGGIGQNPFLVVESTDVTGFIQMAMSSGFNYADAALNNGFAGNIGGVDVYVIRAGTFVSATLGTLVATNANHRLFGQKDASPSALPIDSVRADDARIDRRALDHRPARRQVPMRERHRRRQPSRSRRVRRHDDIIRINPLAFLQHSPQLRPPF